MSLRPQFERYDRDRPGETRAGFAGERASWRSEPDIDRPGERRPARTRRPRPEDDQPSPNLYQAHFSHAEQRPARRFAADEERRRPEAEAPPAQPARRRAAPSGRYMFACAGRQVRLGPVAFWTVVGTLVIMAGWSIVTATYFAFHDDVITRLISRQADLQTAYEDRLTDMRAQVDRVISRQLLDQEQFEQKLDQVVRRQSVLEQRASALGSLADPGVTGSVKPPARHAPASDGLAPKPSPINDRSTPTAPAERRARLDSQSGAAHAAGPGLEARLARLVTALDRVEQRQAASLQALDESFDGKVKRIRTVLSELGVQPGKAPEAGTGGPFVPIKLSGHAGPFERQVHRVQLARAHLDRLNKALLAVPVRRPVSGEIDLSSGFGMRIDPFVGRPAMHTGLDFRGDVGEAIRATASGTVTAAGWSGGYGKMVEIDHGNGLSTRFGHLSEILVRVGQPVKIGHTVGKMGSSGRSTGPHLHYETRVDGEAVDPQRFLRAGSRLAL